MEKRNRKHLKGGNYNDEVIKSFYNYENKYQLLCANCNWIKRVEKGEIGKKY